MNLGFVILYVDDVEKTKAFYTDLVGMSVLEELSGPHFVTLRPSGGSLIALQDKATAQFPPKDEKQSGGVELSFAVDDVDATWRLWKESGVELLSEPMDLPFGRYFIAKDPEDHYVSIYRLARPGN